MFLSINIGYFLFAIIDNAFLFINADSLSFISTNDLLFGGINNGLSINTNSFLLSGVSNSFYISTSRLFFASIGNFLSSYISVSTDFLSSFLTNILFYITC